jgi:CheY-like chemotaxis protein
VLNARDGEEALRLAREAIPDIILLDIMLPKLGGREVMQALRSDPPTAQIPGSCLQQPPAGQGSEAKAQRGCRLLREVATGGALGHGREGADPVNLRTSSGNRENKTTH